jgi:NADH-quinone oxidoreductase subunit L
MVDMVPYAYLIPVFPLAAFAINIFFGKHLRHAASWVSILASLASCAIALPVCWAVAQGGHYAASWPWLDLGGYTLKFGYLLDPLSATLLFVVTICGTLIQIYSSGYMHDDPRYSRFFAYLSLFMFAMLTLVISNNYILFFMSWEVMGLCSYLLIGFWFEKDSAANASRKAFMTTRVGDVGFFLGILTLFVTAGTLEFTELAHAAEHGPKMLGVAALLIFCGTIGKSAQFPLHVWLPDAMEGPTPVSALIHAATMVAAGVYLVARSLVLFSHFPWALETVTFIGLLTAFMAAFIALTATDIKKVLAYSTISQLGFMVTALGLGSLSAGTFHLMTHAFFKALLFLGAGSVIHGTHTQDIREMGGLLGKMKHTAWTFIIGTVAIAGIPPFAGFWSKDEILLAAWDKGNFFVFGALLLCAFMTSFYMFRLTFLTFFGELRNHKIHPHESPASMTFPLWMLALGAIFIGIPGSPFMDHWFGNFINSTGAAAHHGAEAAHHGAHAAHHSLNWIVIGCSVAVGLAGMILAAVFYLGGRNLGKAVSQRFAFLYKLSYNKLWFDEFYGKVFVAPFNKLGDVLFGFDKAVVDGAVNGTGSNTLVVSQIKLWIDKHIVDGLVNFTGHFFQFSSALLRIFQTGYVQHYLFVAFFGILFFIIWGLK